MDVLETTLRIGIIIILIAYMGYPRLRKMKCLAPDVTDSEPHLCSTHGLSPKITKIDKMWPLIHIP